MLKWLYTLITFGLYYVHLMFTSILRSFQMSKTEGNGSIEGGRSQIIDIDGGRPSTSSTLSSNTVATMKDERRSFSRTTSQAWEKFSNVIRKPSSSKDKKDKLRRDELEPRVQSMEYGMKRIGEELESMKKKQMMDHPSVLRSVSSSNLRPSPSEAAHEELASMKEELAATMIELKELNDRHTSLQHAYEKERRAREIAEREVAETRRQLAEGSVPFIDSDGSPRISSHTNIINGFDDKENVNYGLSRLAELEQEIEEHRKKYEESQDTIRDMLIVVRSAQRQKDDAEAEVRRCREAHRSVAAEEDMEIWNELKRGLDSCTTKRNALLAWTKQILSIDYPSLNITNFSSSWADGRAICALISVARPNTVSREDIEKSSSPSTLALSLCEDLSISSMTPLLLCPNGTKEPDWNKIMTLVFDIYKKLYHTNHTK